MGKLIDGIAYLLDVLILHPVVWSGHRIFGCPPQDIYSDRTVHGITIHYCVGCNRVHKNHKLRLED